MPHMASPVTQRVAENVRVELARRGIPQITLARHLFGEHCENAPTLISRRVRGIVPFRVDEIAAVADFLGVSVASLYDGGETAA